MKRIRILITEEQDDRLAALAVDRNVPKAELIGQLIDRALDIDGPDDDARTIIEQTTGVCADYPDWPEWLASVRGRRALRR